MAVYWGSSSAPRSSRHKSRDLPSEFRLFSSFTKQLKKIIYDSNISLAELRSSGHFEEERISALCLQDGDERFVQSIVSDSPCIIILGQTFTAKAAIINRLIGDRVIRLLEPPEDVNEKSWRTIRFKYGTHRRSCLALTESYELVNGDSTPETSWKEIPLAEVELRDEHRSDPALAGALADITLNHALLATKTQVVVSSHNCPNSDVIELFKHYSQRTLPILIYGIESDSITQEEQSELLELKAEAPDLPVLFIDCRPNGDDHPVLVSRHQPHRERAPSDVDPDDSAYDTDEPGTKSDQIDDQALTPPSAAGFKALYQQLKQLGYLKDAREVVGYHPGVPTSEALLAVSRLERLEPLLPIVQFVRQALQLYLVRAGSIVHDLHQLCMNMFITTAFDMQRDIQITPRRIEYAKVKETELFESLKDLANERQEQIKAIILETVEEMKEPLLAEAAEFQFNDKKSSTNKPDILSESGIEIGANDQIQNIKDIKRCTEQIQDLVLARLNTAIVERLISSVEYLHESFVGTLTRCLRSLEEIDTDSDQSASSALGQILNAAYQVEVNVRTSSSIVRVIWERMKEILATIKPFKAPPKVNSDWKRKIALTMINNLDESKLAKSICSQFRARLHNSHDSFSSSLRQLEAKHSGRLEKTEEQRMKVRKVHAPRLARLALDSTSLRDMVLHGMPRLEREIGRGQYGVVYGCRSWGGMSPCAIKSVVPPDDKHWNDLALEFHYTRSIPEHVRVVALRGSVVDHSYGSGTPAVLLIMERLQQDLHTAIKKGLDFPNRLQVALDVVEGIRYLHSLGLVHRDIKLKNVLLDKHNRGKITDLGFCKPEAMMSGSIVGTPIHMAPELFSGRYDSSVDTYAFGILFWYVCAGSVRLPQAFEQCANKDHLWSSVKKGVRPERLTPQFNDECWSLMQACWHGEPAKRPLLGEVSTRLQEIHLQASVARKLSTGGRSRNSSFTDPKMMSL